MDDSEHVLSCFCLLTLSKLCKQQPLQAPLNKYGAGTISTLSCIRNLCKVIP